MTVEETEQIQQEDSLKLEETKEEVSGSDEVAPISEVEKLPLS